MMINEQPETGLARWGRNQRLKPGCKNVKILSVRRKNFCAVLRYCANPFHFHLPFFCCLLLNLLVYFTVVVSSSAVEWQRTTPLPEGIGGFVYGAIGNDLLVAGGISWRGDAKIYRDSIFRFDFRAAQWRKIGSLSVPVAYAASGQAPKGIYFAGGTGGRTTHDIFGFLNSELRLRVIAHLPQPLSLSAHAIGRNKLFIIAGGTDASDLKTITNLAYSLDLKTGKSARVPPYPGGSLFLPAAAVVGGQVYVFGGGAWDAVNNRAINTSSAFTYSIKAGQWKPIKPYPFPVRGLAACPLDNQHILLGGGYGEGFTNFAAIYDKNRDEYIETVHVPVPAMATFIKAGDFIYWVGGEHAMRQRSDAVHRIRRKDLL